MKIKNLLAVLFVPIAFAACNDDKSESTPESQNVAGKYEGYTVTNFKYTSIPITTPKEALTLTPNEDGTTVNVSYLSISWGEFKIANATVTANGSSYTIKGDGKVKMGHTAESQKEYDCTFEGTLKNDKSEPSFKFTVPAVMGGLEVAFTAGDAPIAMCVAKVYKGSMTLDVAGHAQKPIDDSKVTITAEKSGTAQVVLAGFGSGRMALPDLTIPEVPVSTTDYETYTLAESTIDVTVGTTHYTGKLSGTLQKGKAKITFSITPGAMPFPITTVFTSAE